MEHTLNTLINFSSNDYENPKHEKIQSFLYDFSGHVVATNSHVLLATKFPFEIEKAGKSFKSREYDKGHFVESAHDFPNWKEVVPQESARRITIEIPNWFKLFENYGEKATLVIDYKNVESPFFKVVKNIDATSFGFNGKYLSSFAGEKVSMLISSPVSPTVVLREGSSIDPHSKTLKEDILKEDWFYLLMPIKLDDEISNEVYI